MLATGHYRNGVLLTPITADVVAEPDHDGELADGGRAVHPRPLRRRRLGGSMIIYVNGERREVDAPARPRDVLARARRVGRRAASRWPWTARWCPRVALADHELPTGARVEIVTAVQGG